MKDHVSLLLYEFAEYPLAAAIESWDSSSEERSKAEEFLRQVFAAFNYLMKSMLDASPGEQQRTGAVKREEEYCIL